MTVYDATFIASHFYAAFFTFPAWIELAANFGSGGPVAASAAVLFSVAAGLVLLPPCVAHAYLAGQRLFASKKSPAG